MAVCTNNKSYLWQDGIVPFEISPEFTEGSEGRTEILKAINEINSRTNVSLVERTNQSDYAVFKYHEKWCQSWVGRLGGRQEILCAIGKNFKAGNLVHEILHCLGFYHEHQRHDRDEWINVDYGNVKRSIDFEKFSPSITELVTGFDYSSIMIYGRRITNPNLVNDPTKDTLNPLKPLDAETLLGQRGSLSNKDIEGINKIYPKKALQTQKYEVAEPLRAWQWILLMLGFVILLFALFRR